MSGHYLSALKMFSDVKKKAGMHHVSVRGQENHPFAPDPAAQPQQAPYAPGPKEMQNEQKLKLLFNQLARQSHLEGSQTRDETGIVGPADEGSYAPLAVADQANHAIVFNNSSPALQRLELDKGGVPIQPVAPGATPESYQEGVVAHETGHLLEPQLIRDRVGADKYTDATLGTKGRAPYWLENTPQGRGEVRMHAPEILQRDQWGLPMNGPGSTHTAPNEMYANDVGAAFGHPFTNETRSNHPKHDPNYAVEHASRRVMLKLMAQGLLPKGRRGR